MNKDRLPGLRTEDEFNREYKLLSTLIGNLEERSELINLDKKREQEQKKPDFFDTSRSISNQILETNKDLDKKLKYNLGLAEELDSNVQTLRKNTNRMVGEFRHAVSDISTKKAEDLVDHKTREQITAAKNLFFKKVLREIVVGNDKDEEVIKILENQLTMKEKLLKKALLGAEHFRVSIEKVEERHRAVKALSSDFLKVLSQAIGFGHAKVSEELSSTQVRKLLAGDLRSDRNIRESLKLKDKMVVVEQDKMVFYDAVGNEANKIVHSFSDIKEIYLVKDEADINHTLDAFDFGDPNKVGVIFHLKFKNERGGLIIEPDPASVQKWDYTFFIVNLILANSITQSLAFRPLSTEANLGKLFKVINYKALDLVNLKRQMGFDYGFPIEETQVLQDVEDRLVDWQILERCAAMQHESLFKKIGDRVKKSNADEGNSKSTQTELGKGLASFSEGGIGPMETKEGTTKVKELKAKTHEFNYTIPSLSSFVNVQKDLIQMGTEQRDTRDNTGKIGEDGTGQDLPSPQVELDISLESLQDNDSDYRPEFSKKQEEDKKKKTEKTPKKNQDKESRDFSRSLSKGNPLLEKFGQQEMEKADLNSFIVEKAYRQSVLRQLLKGFPAKGSGLGENNGKYVIKLSKDCQELERIDVNAKRKEAKKFMTIERVTFNFEFKDPKSGKIMGKSTIEIIFIDKSFWEFKTPRKNKNTFFSSLIHFRLNNDTFKSLINE